MKRKPKFSEVVTPELVSAVNAYLLARAAAETMRERVNAIQREVLGFIPMYVDAFPQCKDAGRRITDGKDCYLSKDEQAFQDYLDECDTAERKAGLKPADMPRDYCPALVLENVLTKAQRLIVDIAGPVLGLDADRLLCAGLDKYNEFINLTVRLVVNNKGFKNPLTGKGV